MKVQEPQPELFADGKKIAYRSMEYTVEPRDNTIYGTIYGKEEYPEQFPRKNEAQLLNHVTLRLEHRGELMQKIEDVYITNAVFETVGPPWDWEAEFVGRPTTHG